MSALNNLKNKETKSKLELAVLFFGDDQIATSDDELEEAEQAAAELAALEAVAEAANNWIYFDGDPAAIVTAINELQKVREL